jgi:hypothetical protein
MSRFAHVQLEINTGNDGQSCVNYTCGHCGHLVAGIGLAYDSNKGPPAFPRRWLVCPSCGEGSIRTSKWQVLPFAPYGPPIQDLPPEVVPIYKEARTCFGAEAYTACELVCRTLLMHIAVDKGADERQSFAFYIDYLQRNGWITPPMRAWVDLISTTLASSRSGCRAPEVRAALHGRLPVASPTAPFWRAEITPK